MMTFIVLSCLASNTAGLEGGAMFSGIMHFEIAVLDSRFAANRAVYGGEWVIFVSVCMELLAIMHIQPLYVNYFDVFVSV